MERDHLQYAQRAHPLLLALAATAAITASGSASATTNLFNQIPSAPQSCNTCHLGAPGSPRNAFGLQVEANLTGDGNTGTIDWPTLCALDADDDGSTNGAELGDPCCLFGMDTLPTLPATDPSNALETSTNACDDTDGGPPVVIPPGWTCSAAQLNNGDCDCGCGVLDSECSSSAFAACDLNGCNEGVVDVVDTTQCLDNEGESEWTCGFAAYEDGATCDCGCGVVDPDCTNSECDASGCRPGTEVSPDDNTACIQSEAFVGARPGWWCATDWYAGDDGCDCGCGLIDPDCPRAPQLSDCTQQGCAYSPLIENTVPDASDVAKCIEPVAAPADWTCDASWYGTGDGCDCGCGTADVDCEAESFEYCTQSGCEDDLVVDKSDFTACVDPAQLQSCAQTSTSTGLWVFGLGACLLWRRRRQRRSRIGEQLEMNARTNT